MLKTGDRRIQGSDKMKRNWAQIGYNVLVILVICILLLLLEVLKTQNELWDRVFILTEQVMVLDSQVNG
jgi:hypothetical protein